MGAKRAPAGILSPPRSCQPMGTGRCSTTLPAALTETVLGVAISLPSIGERGYRLGLPTHSRHRSSGPAVEFAGNVSAESAALPKTLPPSDRRTHTLVVTGTAPGRYGGNSDVHV